MFDQLLILEEDILEVVNVGEFYEHNTASSSQTSCRFFSQELSRKLLARRANQGSLDFIIYLR